mmetsp:Transcript_3989/g.13393  ORF Transcript_3989/g.13393 Transcript_3989/m.13393 type:complete len:380 (+) Transcript_3989:1584-2723(+)
MRRKPTPTSREWVMASVNPRSSSLLAATMASPSRAASSRPGRKVTRQGKRPTPQAGAPIHVASCSRELRRRRPSRAAVAAEAATERRRRAPTSFRRHSAAGPDGGGTGAATEASTAVPARCPAASRARRRAMSASSISMRASLRSATRSSTSSKTLDRANSNLTTSLDAFSSLTSSSATSIDAFSSLPSSSATSIQGRIARLPKPYQASRTATASLKAGISSVRQSRRWRPQPSSAGNEPPRRTALGLMSLDKTTSVNCSTRSMTSTTAGASTPGGVHAGAGASVPLRRRRRILESPPALGAGVVAAAAQSARSWAAASRKRDQTRALDFSKSTESIVRLAPPKARSSESSAGGQTWSPTSTSRRQSSVFLQDSLQVPS